MFAPVTLGRTVTKRAVSGFTFTDTIHAPRTKLGRHAHEKAAISFVLRGAFVQLPSRADAVEVNRHTVLLEPAGHEHETRYAGATTRTFIVEISREYSRLANLGSRLFERYTLIEEETAKSLMRELAFESTQNPPDDFRLQVCAIELLAVISGLAPRAETGSWLADVRKVVRERFASKVTLAEIGAAVGRHPMHVCKAFRSAFGYSIGSYVRDCQLRHALHALHRSRLPIGRIAADAGFSDQSHLGRVFKAVVGMPPKIFRQMAQR